LSRAVKSLRELSPLTREAMVSVPSA